MAHAAFHFSLGMTAATAAMVPLWLRRRREPGRLAPFFACWIGAALLAGGWAIAPSLLRHVGLPESFCRGWWMNVFFLHPWLQHVAPGRGMLPGALLILLGFALPYSLMVAAIASGRRTAGERRSRLARPGGEDNGRRSRRACPGGEENLVAGGRNAPPPTPPSTFVPPASSLRQTYGGQANPRGEDGQARQPGDYN